MFEAAELGRKVSKTEFDKIEPELHTSLLSIQRELMQTNIPVIVIVSGVEGAGKGEVVNCLNKWLDTRGISTTAFWDESDEELERPAYWRFWRRLPPRGTIGIMFGSWYTRPIIDFVFKKINTAEYEKRLQRISKFERMLSEDGALIIKFWFHMSEKDQRRQLEKENKDKKYTPLLKKFSKRYKQFSRASEHAIRMTDQGASPWHVVEAVDRRYRDLTVGRILHDALLVHLKNQKAGNDITASNEEELTTLIPDDVTVLSRVDTEKTIPDKSYDKQLNKYQRKFYQLTWQAKQKKRSSIAMFEGWDASGKGGAIRRMTAAMDARLYKTISVAAPTDEERAQHYLWRFWRHLPRAGYVTIYDRSWYGRVLVERVEGFAGEYEWQRAYQEINEFEEQLFEHGIILSKFWIHITEDEQLRRFKEREQTPWKAHKITDEDWRNREKWQAYEQAINDMVTHTSTEYAPWILIPGNDKRVARVEILKAVCGRLEEGLDNK
jgi:AMP-polyphosphate phosphotransferase